MTPAEIAAVVERLEKLEALEKAATPVDALTVTNYTHGGGRVFVDSIADRALVADFFEEADRECWIAARRELRWLLSAARLGLEREKAVEADPLTPEEWLLLDRVLLPTNPNKMRVAHGSVVAMVVKAKAHAAAIRARGAGAAP